MKTKENAPAASARALRAGGPAWSRRGERGFSLLEVMVAVAIFALTVTTLFVVRGRSIEQAFLAKNIEVAERYGKLLLEDIILGNQEYRDGDVGKFEAPEAKDLQYEIFIEEVTIAGTPPDDDESAGTGTHSKGSSGKVTIGGDKATKSSKSKQSGTGSSDDQMASDSTDSSADASGAAASKGKKKKKGGGGGLFGDGDEAEPEVLLRVSVRVTYPVGDENDSLVLETYVPEPKEEDDTDTATQSGTKGKKSGSGKSGSGEKQQKKGKGSGDDAMDDLFGG